MVMDPSTDRRGWRRAQGALPITGDLFPPYGFRERMSVASVVNTLVTPPGSIE